MKSQQHNHKQKRQGRTTLVLLCLIVSTLVSLSVVYSVEWTMTAAPKLESKPAASRIDQLCQQKLLDHIKQGGVDLQAEMSYGDLQGCSFSSRSERATQDIEMSIINRDSIL